MTTLPPSLPRDAALFLDVDGTLLDIAPRPELVQVPRHLPPLLGRLADERGGALALVSGRTIADLDRLFDPWRGAAAGLHGRERRRLDGSWVAMVGDGAADVALDRIRSLAAQFVADHTGVLLEDKGGTLALHYRAAPQFARESLQFVENQLTANRNSLRLIAGKMVFELVPLHQGKDRAIAMFLDEAPFHGRFPVFLGDDVTDEDGFAEINRRGGLSIRVGPSAEATVAACALPTVSATLAWLEGQAPDRNR
jgi:trehalose 6-phosphate phosphatase